MTLVKTIPGIALIAVLTLVAYVAAQFPFFSRLHPMFFALLLGVAMKSALAIPKAVGPGIAFSQRHVLRTGVALLGIQISFAQIVEVGVAGLAILISSLIATFAFTISLGRILGVDAKLATLMASGTAVCGASAIVATNAVTRAPEEDVTYAIASITLFGTLSIAIYPMLLPLTGLDPRQYGLWVGASVHEVGQVAAAAFQGGAEAGIFGTTSKLVRVIALAPLVMALGWYVSRRSCSSGVPHGRIAPVPWFVLGFLGFVAINSVIDIEPALRARLAQATVFLMTMALAAIGLQTDFSKLRLRGAKPFLLGLCAWAFISTGTFALVFFLT